MKKANFRVLTGSLLVFMFAFLFMGVAQAQNNVVPNLVSEAEAISLLEQELNNLQANLQNMTEKDPLHATLNDKYVYFTAVYESIYVGTSVADAIFLNLEMPTPTNNEMDSPKDSYVAIGLVAPGKGQPAGGANPLLDSVLDLLADD